MTTIKKALSTAGTTALVCGFVVILGAPGHLDAFDGTFLDVIKQIAIGVGMCVIGAFFNRCAK